MILTLDIETLPTTGDEVIDAIAATIRPPANYSKPDTIAKWMDENYAQALKDAVAKTSFDGLYGSIACIAWAFDDEEVFSVDANQLSEANALELFFREVNQSASIARYREISETVICGHNVAAFDLPFLKHRSIINGIKPPLALRKAMRAKPWEDCIADTMLMWSAERDKRVSMDKLCKALGIEGKGDFDGSMVADTWKTDPQKVIDYCKDDVRRTREIYKRLTWA
jgi:3'-5' exonuclease